MYRNTDIQSKIHPQFWYQVLTHATTIHLSLSDIAL